MALSIKNEETVRLARKVAQRNGETVTMAVTIALKERLERLGEPPKRKSRLEALMEFSELCAPLFKNSPSGNELINDLYDEETGLPR
ncbi:MAG: type II toxin-antitoxin system VapB family antitoxin [Terracidiphilus sp.]|jgi:antitoxin VapB